MKLWAKDVPGRNSGCNSYHVGQVRKSDLVLSECPVERSREACLRMLMIFLGTTEAYFVKYLNILSKASACRVNSDSWNQADAVS